MENNISIKKAVLINGSLKYTAALINIGFAALLARVIKPEDFGIVAVTTVFVNFFKVIADAGMGPAVIQYKKLGKKDMNSIFTFSFYMAAMLSVLMLLLAIPVSRIYENPAYKKLFAILSISVFFCVINTVPNAILMREKRFARAGVRMVVSVLLSSVIAFILALNGAGYYALMIQSVSSAVITFSWNMYQSGLKIKRRVSKEIISMIGGYSGYQFMFNFVNYFSRNMDNLLIGKVLGNINLAFYEKSYTLMMYPVQGLTQVITPVLHPIMSEYQEDKEKIYSQYRKLILFLSVCGCFVSVFCVWNAREIIFIIFGGKWAGAVQSMRILGVSIWAQMIVSASGAAYQSIGNTKLLLISGTIGAATTVGSILLGLKCGSIEYVALFVMISYIIMAYITHIIMMRWGFHKKIFSFLKEIIPDFLFLAGMSFLFIFLETHPAFCSVFIKTLLLIMLFAIYLFITRRYKILELLLRRK